MTVNPLLTAPPVGHWRGYAAPSSRIQGMFADANALRDEQLQKDLNAIFAKCAADMEHQFDFRVRHALRRAAGDVNLALQLASLVASYRATADELDRFRGAVQPAAGLTDA